METSSPEGVSILDKDESSEKAYHVVDGFVIEDSKSPFPVSSPQPPPQKKIVHLIAKFPLNEVTTKLEQDLYIYSIVVCAWFLEKS